MGNSIMIENISEDKLVWSALDAPKLEPKNWDLFWKKWNEHAGPSYIDKPDPAGNRDYEYERTGVRNYPFIGLNIYANDPKVINDGHWKLPFLSYTEIFPNLLEDIYSSLPWVKEVTAARLWSSVKNIPFHKDYAIEDVAIRSMIYDENKQGTFKLWRPGIKTTYVELPQDTNWFVYNNEKCLHGSDKLTDAKKIILLLVYHAKSKELMIEHLKRSAIKYPDYHVYY